MLNEFYACRQVPLQICRIFVGSLADLFHAPLPGGKTRLNKTWMSPFLLRACLRKRAGYNALARGRLAQRRMKVWQVILVVRLNEDDYDV